MTPSLQSEDFEAWLLSDYGELRLMLSGHADTRVSGGLEALFAAVHAEVKGAGATRIWVDVRQVSFMNSSCLKSLLTWLELAHNDASGSRYAIEFVVDSTQDWPRRSLPAIVSFAADITSISVIEGDTKPSAR